MRQRPRTTGPNVVRPTLVDPLPTTTAVTTTPPISAGNPDPQDLDAAEQLHHNEDARLQIVRARAEKWIGGVGALTGVLGTVLVIKGPDDATHITLAWRIVSAVMLATAIGLLALATYRAYRAAFGKPNALSEISAIPLTGLHKRLEEARRTEAADALRDLGAAIRSVFIAVALIAAAVGVTWFAPPKNPAPTRSSLCMYARDQLVARLDTDALAVKQTTPGTTVKPC